MKPIRFLPKIKRGQVCLNCDLPLAGEENFCPNCGQRNDTRGLNFGSFIHAIFLNSFLTILDFGAQLKCCF